MQYKRPLNNNKISNIKTTVYTNEEVENGAMKHDMKKHTLPPLLNINRIVYSIILVIF